MAGITDRRQPEDTDAARGFGERQHHGDRFVSGRWALGPEVKRAAVAGGAMLYDTSRAGNFAPAWVDPAHWRARGELDGGAQGRATAHFINSADKRYVLRHYHRGGLMAHISRDRYSWRSEESTRP